MARNLKLAKLVEGLNEAYNSKVEVTSERSQSLSITTALPYDHLMTILKSSAKRMVEPFLKMGIK